ncbi:MAG: PqqD family protein [Methanoregulaceae archaeon]|nr:PqqD family protein [Methanoregulaceae archaeon]
MTSARIDAAYMPSRNIVVREIEGEFIIVPLVRGIGDMEEDLFSLNDEGKEIWKHLDGKNTLRQVAAALRNKYSDPERVIEQDVLGFAEELLNRKMLVEVASPPGTSPGS